MGTLTWYPLLSGHMLRGDGLDSACASRVAVMLSRADVIVAEGALVLQTGRDG